MPDTTDPSQREKEVFYEVADIKISLVNSKAAAQTKGNSGLSWATAWNESRRMPLPSKS